MPRTPHPRLRPSTPVVRRSSGRVQIGVGSGSVVLDVDEAGRRFLASLTGEHPLAVLASAAGLRVPVAQRLVRSLELAGLLAGVTSLADRTVKVVGCGLLGSRLVRLLVRAGLRRVLLADDDPADPAVHMASRPGSSNADALADRLSRDLTPGKARVEAQVLAHWTKPDGARPDLTVVATDAPECDRAITDTLARDDLAHLLLRGQDDGVVVGPFVRPGCSSCVRCADLHRRDRDPAWPAVLHQLSRVGGRPGSPVAEWGAATTATQVLAWADGRRPETWGATLELSGRDWVTRLRTWPVHPQCGCAGLGPG